jgi:hypothetical protein
MFSGRTIYVIAPLQLVPDSSFTENERLLPIQFHQNGFNSVFSASVTNSFSVADPLPYPLLAPMDGNSMRHTPLIGICGQEMAIALHEPVNYAVEGNLDLRSVHGCHRAFLDGQVRTTNVVTYILY